jgi:autotransporter-associated beta strand protein
VSGSYGQTLNTGLFDSTDVVYAENTGGSAQTFDSISFGAGTITFSGNSNVFHEGGKPSQSGTYGITGPDTVTLGAGSLPALTIGQRYKIQVLVYDGRSDVGIPGRTVRMDGINQGVYAHGIYNVNWGNGLLVTGTFTADATTQAFTVEAFSGAVTKGGLMNALVLNTLPALAVTTTPTFTPPGADYNAAQSVTLTSDTGATIYYTTDGSDPVTSGTRISGTSPLSGIVIPIDTTITLKTYATNPGNTDSAVVSATYRTYSTTAPTDTWGNLAGGAWATGANWTDGFVPNGIGITADFSTLTLTANAVVNLATAATVGNLRFADQGNAYDWSITNGSLTLNTIAGAPEIHVSNRSATISSVLTGTQGLTKTGAGTLALYVGNTFTGGLTVQQGAVDAKGPWASSSALGSGAVTIGSGATVTKTDNDFQEIKGDLTLMGGTLAATGTANKDYGNFFLISKVIHTGDVQSVISARLHMRGTHEFSVADGAAPIDLLVSGHLGNEEGYNWGYVNKTEDGTMAMSNAGNNIGGLTISAGKVLLLGALPGFEDTGITNNSALEISIASGSGTFSQAISGSGTFTKTGSGTLTLSGSNTYTGTTSVNDGELAIGLPLGTKWNATQLNLGSGTTLALLNFNSISGTPAAEATVGLTTSGTVTLRVGGTFTVGTYPLILYPLGTEIGGAGFGSFILGPMPEGVTAHLENDAENASVNLVVTAAGTPFSNWMANNYPSLTGDDALATADPDHDRMNNLAEFAFKGDPTNGADNGLLAGLPADTNANGNKELTLTVAVRAGATFAGSPSPAATVDGVTYTLQGSLDLSSFTSGVTEAASALSPAQTGLPDITGSGWEYHTFILTGSEGLPGRGFLRAAVTQ